MDAAYSMIISGSPNSTGWPFSTRMRLDRSAARRLDLVHGLHRLDDQERLPLAHHGADIDKGRRARFWRAVGGADHRRGHNAWVIFEA